MKFITEIEKQEFRDKLQKKFYSKSQEEQKRIRENGYNKEFQKLLKEYEDIINYYTPSLIKKKSGKWQFHHFRFFKCNNIKTMNCIIEKGYICNNCKEPLPINFSPIYIIKNKGYIFLKRCKKWECSKSYQNFKKRFNS